jgi:MoxR-vWA-beta-propeller ternary system domain bpX0/MoxR-vWA-beta-propeller ternary system domain bpX1
MSDAHQLAVDYFRCTPDDPWRWAEQGKVLVWCDGTTVAFQEEVASILESLAPAGLPPFRAVMVLIAACRGKFPPSAASLGLRPEGAMAASAMPGTKAVSFVPTQLSLLPWNDPANQDFSEFLARLRALHQLPAELRNSPRAKALLIDAVFEGHPARRIQPAAELIRMLRDGWLSEAVLNSSETNGKSSVANNLFLHYRLKEISSESLALRMRTGLEELPAQANLELKPAERVRLLLAQLQSDPDHEGLAKVTRDVMAALYRPRSLSEMDELALGGFSDISNRGSLDRLLPSELANDDVTLAARIALNEALYFRREPPANHPPGRFAVLLDAGVRTWGLPRVFGTAVALALMGREDHHGEVTAWRAARHSVERIDLFTRAGLVDHLAVLHTSTQPSASLKPFFAQLAGEPEVEAVLVTQRDTLADPVFQALLRQVDSKTFYLATVDRDGSFEMFLHPFPDSLLCQAVISLDSLFYASGRPSAPLRDERRDPNLPLILSLRPFPFLLPVVGKIQKAVRFSRGGGIAVMQDRRLLRWESVHQGAQVLASALPQGRTLWLGTSNFGHKVHVLKHRTNQARALLTTWNSTTDDLVTLVLPLPDNQTLRAYAQNGVLFLVNRRRILAFDMDTGHALGAIPPPDPRSLSTGKYFVQPDGTRVFLSYDGHSLQFQPVTLKPFLPPRDILALFDRESFEGPWILTVRGEVYSHAGEQVINLGRTISNFDISPDGQRILVPSVGDSRNFQLIDLETARCNFTPAWAAPKALDPSIVPPTANLRARFGAIHLPSTGGVALRDAGGVWRRLADMDGKSLFLQLIPTPPDAASARGFEPLPLTSSHPFTLRVAAWPDGRRAWLDSRGLLHLRSPGPTQPELTFVLADNAMAGWSSDGLMAGAPFFIPSSSAQIRIPEMFEKILHFSPGW